MSEPTTPPTFTIADMVESYRWACGANLSRPSDPCSVKLYLPLDTAKQLKAVLTAFDTLITWKPDAPRVPRIEAASALLKRVLTAGLVDKERGYVWLEIDEAGIVTLRDAYTLLLGYEETKESDRKSSNKKRGYR